MKTIRINRGTKLNYDDVLENIAAVVYVENSTGCRPDLIHMAHIADRTETTDKGDLWYKGCFENCIICLAASNHLYPLLFARRSKIRDYLCEIT